MKQRLLVGIVEKW